MQVSGQVSVKEGPMKVKVKIEFDIEGDEILDREELKHMIFEYLAEGIETEELDYDLEFEDEDELN